MLCLDLTRVYCGNKTTLLILSLCPSIFPCQLNYRRGENSTTLFIFHLSAGLFLYVSWVRGEISITMFLHPSACLFLHVCSVKSEISHPFFTHLSVRFSTSVEPEVWPVSLCLVLSICLFFSPLFFFEPGVRSVSLWLFFPSVCLFPHVCWARTGQEWDHYHW